MSALLTLLYSQLFVTPPTPTASFAGKTVIVTGSNVGLGKEAARHYARLGASTVVLAVRNLEKGEAAKRDIDQSAGCGPDVVNVWHLDLASYQSVKDFAARASKELARIDVLLENAAIATFKYIMMEDNESTITVNVVSTFLLAFLMMPKLKETARKFNVRPNLTIVCSFQAAGDICCEGNGGEDASGELPHHAQHRQSWNVPLVSLLHHVVRQS
jgi:NAD(P)-dependent dehydrogenase (short-subunit alcohol dehydrogenase family)